MNVAIRAVLLSILCVSLAWGQRGRPATLQVGDKAPPLAGGKWMQGQAVRTFEEGKIYVIEMWATWCGPCVAAIPHINRMQEEYGRDGLIVIGQNIWEDDPADVEPFLKKMANDMTYRVVMDDVSGGGRGRMATLWMDAAGQNGIPCSFVVGKDGRIAWIGHPMTMEPVLKKIIAGTFDPDKAAAEQLAMDQLERRLETAMNNQDWPRALALLDDFRSKQAPGTMLDRVDTVRFNVLLHRKDYPEAYALGAKLAEQFKDDAGMLNEIAWTIADEPGLEKRDLDLAEKMAVRAVELSKRGDPAILDTLARVHFEKGRIDEAIEFQTLAVNKAPADLKPMFQRALEKYRAAKK